MQKLNLLKIFKSENSRKEAWASFKALKPPEHFKRFFQFQFGNYSFIRGY